MSIKKKCYVIGVDDAPWVLTPEGTNRAACQRAIDWQGVGNSPASDWRICHYVRSDAGQIIFADVDSGKEYRVINKIYTVEAWTKFCDRWAAE